MTSLVIGMGEIGSALHSILQKAYPEVYSGDVKDPEWTLRLPAKIDIMHICIPYSDSFVEIVKSYITNILPKYVVIHSSVPVGTTKKIGFNCFHSPVRGVHPKMVEGLTTYLKYISYNDNIRDVEKVMEYLEKTGMTVKVVNNTDSTELMKLLELCRYGVYIAFAKEQEAICECFGLDYQQIVTPYEESRNDGMLSLGTSHLCQPVLYPFKDYVGGHCTVEDMELLLKQVEDVPLLDAAYRIDRGTTIWPNSNIYPTAKIGKGCSIGQFCEIGNNVVIGNNVRISAFTFIPEGVVIEDDVFVAPRVSFSNDKHPPSGKDKWGKILIKKGAVIGMGAIILPGVTVGENAIVGAGAVVTKDVAPCNVVYGTAAYPHGTREEIYK